MSGQSRHNSEFITVQSFGGALAEHKERDEGADVVGVVPLFEDCSVGDCLGVDNNSQGSIEPGSGDRCQVFIAKSYPAAPLTDLDPLLGN